MSSNNPDTQVDPSEGPADNTSGAGQTSAGQADDEVDPSEEPK